MKAQTKSRWAKYIRPDGTWDVDAMSHQELDALAEECEHLDPAQSRELTPQERARFEAWQEKALAHETARKTHLMTLAFPASLFAQIGQAARRKHTTPANLVKRIVQQALQHA